MDLPAGHMLDAEEVENTLAPVPTVGGRSRALATQYKLDQLEKQVCPFSLVPACDLSLIRNGLYRETYKLQSASRRWGAHCSSQAKTRQEVEGVGCEWQRLTTTTTTTTTTRKTMHHLCRHVFDDESRACS